PPTHLHYFSAATISELLRRKGFDVVHLSHPGNSRSLRAALYFITVLQMKRQRLYDALQGFRIFNWHLTVNLFDIMYVIARRQLSRAAIYACFFRHSSSFAATLLGIPTTEARS